MAKSRKIYRLRIIISADGEIDSIKETFDSDKMTLMIKGHDMTEFLDEESNEILQECTEVGIT